MAVRDILLSANQDTAGAIVASRDLEKERRGRVDSVRPLANNVVQAQVKLIVDELCLDNLTSFAGGVLVCFRIIDL